MSPSPSDGIEPDGLGSLLQSMPFAVACGIELVSATPGRVEARLAWAPERTTAGSALHGGALMALADSVGAICAFLNLPEGATTSTIESKTSFFRGVREGSVTATSEPLHVGRTTIAVQTDIRDDRGRRVALVLQTQIVLTPSTARHDASSAPVGPA